MVVMLGFFLLVINLLPSVHSAAECSVQRNRGRGLLTLGGRVRQSPSQGQDPLLPRIIILKTPRPLKKLGYRSSGRIFFWSSQQKFPRRGGVPEVEICPSQTPVPCMEDERISELDVLPAFGGEEVDVIFDNVKSRSLDVRWREWNRTIDRGYTPMAGYVVKYLSNGNIETISTTENHVSVRDLSPSTEYRFQIAVKAGGIFTGRIGEPTEVFVKKTMCEKPSEPQLNVNSSSILTDMAELDVQLPTPEEWLCDNIVAHLQRNKTGNWETEKILNVSTPRQPVLVKELKPCSDYHYRLQINNTAGNAVSEVEFTTNPAEPDLPTLSLRSTDNTVNVDVNITDFESWECSEPIVELRGRKLGSRTIDIRRNLTLSPSGIISSTITDLEACSTYEFQIKISSTKINANTTWFNISTKPEASTMFPVVTVTKNTSTHLAFAWSSDSCLCCENYITKYVYRLVHNGIEEREGNTKDKSVEFSDLTPFSNYLFYVRALTDVGYPNITSSVSVNTSEDAPNAITRISVQFVNGSSSANVTWRAPTRTHGVIIGYNFTYKLTGSEDWNMDSVTLTYILLLDLTPFSEYEFMVRAWTSVGPGNWSSSKTFTTPQTASSPPRNVTIVERSQTWMVVSWVKPLLPNGYITNYEIRYRPTHSSGSEEFQFILTAPSVFTRNITSLEPSTAYTIQVSAINGFGRGESVNMRNATKHTIDLTPVRVTEVTITGDIEDGFVIYLPTLTQKYATNYVILIILIDGRNRTVSVNGTDPTYKLTREKLEVIFGEPIPFDIPPKLQVGVATNNGVEDPYIVWSDPIPLEPTHNSRNHVFYLIIMGVFTFSICFIAIVAGSFAIGRAMRKVKDKTGLVADDSAYLALESRNAEKDSDGRYIPLNIKIPECREPDQDSIEKVKLDIAKEAAENVAAGSSYSEIDVVPPNHDTLATTVKTFQASTDQRPKCSNTVQGLDAQELGRNKGNIADNLNLKESGLNRDVVKRAVEKFKLGAIPQAYSSGIYDGPSDAQLKTTTSTNKKSLHGSTRSQQTSYVDIDNVDNFRRSVSYIEPDDCECTEATPAYNVIDKENSTKTASLDVDKSYIELDEEAMAGCSGGMNRDMPSYIELDEETNGTERDRKDPTSHGTPSQNQLDQKITGSDARSSSPVESKTSTTTASYIELDEEAMAKDSLMKSASDNITNHSKIETSSLAYITLDDEAMLNDSITETKSPLTVLTRQNAQRKKHSYSDTIIQNFGNFPEDKSSSLPEMVINDGTVNSQSMSTGNAVDILPSTNGSTPITRRMNYEKSLPVNPFNVNGATDIYEFEGNTGQRQGSTSGKVVASKKKMSYERSFPTNPFITNEATVMYDENVVVNDGGNTEGILGATASEVSARLERKQPSITRHRPTTAKKPIVNRGTKPAAPPRRISYEKSLPGNPFLADRPLDIIYDDTDVVIEELHRSPQSDCIIKPGMGYENSSAVQSQLVNYGNQFTGGGEADIYDDAESASPQPTSQDGVNNLRKPNSGSTFPKPTQGIVSKFGFSGEVDGLYSNADGVTETCIQIKHDLGGISTDANGDCFYDETSLPEGNKEDDPEGLYEEIPAFSKKTKEKPRSLLSRITGKSGRNGRGKRNSSHYPGFAVGKNKALESIRESEDDTYEELPDISGII